MCETTLHFYPEFDQIVTEKNPTLNLVIWNFSLLRPVFSMEVRICVVKRNLATIFGCRKCEVIKSILEFRYVTYYATLVLTNLLEIIL
jgi:hypothetical protein